MGAYASNFTPNESVFLPEDAHPSKDSWINLHAEKTQLTTLEVGRLWLRFQQLGADEDGHLDQAVLGRAPASDDIFVKNMLSMLRLQENHIEFLTFLLVMKWIQSAAPETKTKAIFALLNGGNPVSEELFGRILKRIYPAESEDYVTKTKEALFSNIDVENTGHITETQFVNWIMSLSEDVWRPLLKFTIIPDEIRPSEALPQNEQDDPVQERPDPSELVPTDELLSKLALALDKKTNWQRLWNQLGFTQKEATEIKKKHKSSKRENTDKAVVQAMLFTWRDKEGPNATCGVLKKALLHNGMQEICELLYATGY